MCQANLTIQIHIVIAQERGITTFGEPPEKIAERLLESVLRDHKEDFSASFQFAYWLRVTCPSFYHFMIARRAEQAITANAPKEPERYWANLKGMEINIIFI